MLRTLLTISEHAGLGLSGLPDLQDTTHQQYQTMAPKRRHGSYPSWRSGSYVTLQLPSPSLATLRSTSDLQPVPRFRRSSTLVVAALSGGRTASFGVSYEYSARENLSAFPTTVDARVGVPRREQALAVTRNGTSICNQTTRQ
jgi:hypothetical protein